MTAKVRLKAGSATGLSYWRNDLVFLSSLSLLPYGESETTEYNVKLEQQSFWCFREIFPMEWRPSSMGAFLTVPGSAVKRSAITSLHLSLPSCMLPEKKRWSPGMLQHVASLLRTKAHETTCPQKHSGGCLHISTCGWVTRIACMPQRGLSACSDWRNLWLAFKGKQLAWRRPECWLLLLSPSARSDGVVPQPHVGFVPLAQIAARLVL